MRLATGTSAEEEAGGLLIPGWAYALFERWPLLLIGAVVPAALAAIVVTLAPTVFIAEALVVPTRARTQVEFEPRIRTVDAASSAGGQAASLSSERRQALADLASGGEIESAVAHQLSGRIPDDRLAPGGLVGQIRAVFRPRSEVLAIQAIAPTPAEALAVANTWAGAYVEHINKVYGGTSDAATPRAALIAQREDARGQYEGSERSLVADVQRSRLEELDRLIEEKLQNIRLLQAAYQAGSLEALPNLSGQQASGTATPGARLDGQAAREDFRLSEVRTLNDLAQLIRKLEVSRQAALVLVYQAEQAGLGAGDAAALAVLRTQLVALPGTSPEIQLQVQPGVESTATLRALAGGIDRAIEDARREFDARRSDYEVRRSEQLSELEEEVRALRAQRENAGAVRRELTLTRDLSWETYSALARKAEERAVAEGTESREVELASRATLAEPVAKRTVYAALIAGTVGLAFAVLVIVTPTLLQPLRGRGLVRRREASL